MGSDSHWWTIDTKEWKTAHADVKTLSALSTMLHNGGAGIEEVSLPDRNDIGLIFGLSDWRSYSLLYQQWYYKISGREETRQFLIQQGVIQESETDHEFGLKRGDRALIKLHRQPYRRQNFRAVMKSLGVSVDREIGDEWGALGAGMMKPFILLCRMALHELSSNEPVNEERWKKSFEQYMPRDTAQAMLTTAVALPFDSHHVLITQTF